MNERVPGEVMPIVSLDGAGNRSTVSAHFNSPGCFRDFRGSKSQTIRDPSPFSPIETEHTARWIRRAFLARPRDPLSYHASCLCLTDMAMLHVVNSSWPQHDELILARTEQVSAGASGLPLQPQTDPALS